LRNLKKQEPPQETNDLSWEDVDDPDELEKQKQLEKHKAEKKNSGKYIKDWKRCRNDGERSKQRR